MEKEKALKIIDNLKEKSLKVLNTLEYITQAEDTDYYKCEIDYILESILSLLEVCELEVNRMAELQQIGFIGQDINISIAEDTEHTVKEVRKRLKRVEALLITLQGGNENAVYR